MSQFPFALLDRELRTVSKHRHQECIGTCTGSIRDEKNFLILLRVLEDEREAERGAGRVRVADRRNDEPEPQLLFGEAKFLRRLQRKFRIRHV